MRLAANAAFLACRLSCCQAVNTRQANMAELLLGVGADPLVVSSYSKPAPAGALVVPNPDGVSSSSSTEPPSVVRRTTLLHLLLGNDRQHVFGSAHPALQARILQACINAAVAEASKQRDKQLQSQQLERDLAAGSAAEQEIARSKLRTLGVVPQHVLGDVVDEDGEAVGR